MSALQEQSQRRRYRRPPAPSKAAATPSTARSPDFIAYYVAQMPKHACCHGRGNRRARLHAPDTRQRTGAGLCATARVIIPPAARLSVLPAARTALPSLQNKEKVRQRLCGRYAALCREGDGYQSRILFAEPAHHGRKS